MRSAVNGVGAEQSAEHQHFGSQEDPHPQLRAHELLLGAVEVVSEVGGMMDVAVRIVAPGEGGCAMGVGYSAHLRLVPFVVIIAIAVAIQCVTGSISPGGGA